MERIGDPYESSSSSEKVEPQDLLEECWFFENLLDKRAKTLLRCYSDPCPSSNNKASGKSSSTIKGVSQGRDFVGPKLMRTPSLPPCRASGEETNQEKESNRGNMMKSSLQSPRNNLHRTPSLPPCIGREEDAESEFSLSKLIRQASLNSSDVLPPRRISKGMKNSCSVPKHGLRKNPELKSIDREACKETKMRTRLRELEIEKVQGFKNLGFKFEKKDSNPSLVRNYATPIIPNWVDKKSSSAADMKAHIKFWARAVAANVR